MATMEERMTRIEVGVEHLASELDRLKADTESIRNNLACLNERVAHLPTKEFIFKGIAGLLAAMVAIATLAPKLQAIFGVAR